MKVAILGATGETGSSIVDALLESTDPAFEVTALTRPSAVGGDEANAIEKRGAEIVAIDLDGPRDALVAALRNHDVVISAIRAWALDKQIPLVDAAKEAGVARFVPCDFGTVCPPGVMSLRDRKEEIHNYIKRVYQPYTFIDVGWWYQLGFPRLPSGKIDYATVYQSDSIPGDGAIKSAMTDKSDIGRWVARIIADPRTLNKSVFAYNQVWTKNDIYLGVEHMHGPPLSERGNINPETAKLAETFYPKASEEVIKKAIADALASTSPHAHYAVASNEYSWSWGIRGDNTPEHAEYLGYLNAWELYPDFQPKTFEAFVKDLMDGKVSKVYTRDAKKSSDYKKAMQ